MKPDFIGLSPGRTGTAWIYNCLSEHPQICLPYKIINFFNDDSNFAKGFEWYETHFRTCSRGKSVGEISLYLHSAEACRRIYDYHSTVKLLVPLRNPVDRAFAAYENELSAGLIPAKTRFEDALKRRPLYIERGFYCKELKRYLSYFSRDQMLVSIYEDGLRDPEGFMRSFYEFLEVDPDFTPAMLRDWVNVGGVPRSASVNLTLNIVAESMRKWGLHKLIWLLKRSGVVGLVHRANLRSAALPMTPEQRAELQAMFEPEIKALEELLQRDLSGWLNQSTQTSGAGQDG